MLEQIWPRNDDGSWKRVEELDVLDYIMLGEYGIDPSILEDIQFIARLVTGADD